MSTEPKTYRGNCHCGGFIFEVKTPEIATSVIGCDCSSCTKKAYAWLFLPEGAVTVVKDEGKLSEFICGPHGSTHRFCSICGTAVMAVNPAYRLGTAVNARALQGVDIWSLDVTVHDGAKINPQWISPVYSGKEPTPDFDGGHAYHGSCRCGMVQIAVKLKEPLEQMQGVECNCSICQRGGYIWIYPLKSQIALTNTQNLTGYTFGNRIWKKMFCKTCGVHLYTDLAVSDDEEWAALPDQTRKENEPRRGFRPLNVRVLDGVDVLGMGRVRANGWASEPGYVNP